MLVPRKVILKIYELDFYSSRTVGHRFWRTLQWKPTVCPLLPSLCKCSVLSVFKDIATKHTLKSPKIRAGTSRSKIRTLTNWAMPASCQRYKPYSKMAAILVFVCFLANCSVGPCSRLNILWTLTFESKAKRANLKGNKRILNSWPLIGKGVLCSV